METQLTAEVGAVLRKRNASIKKCAKTQKITW